jgi:hypothetical protein
MVWGGNTHNEAFIGNCRETRLCWSGLEESKEFRKMKTGMAYFKKSETMRKSGFTE